MPEIYEVYDRTQFSAAFAIALSGDTIRLHDFDYGAWDIWPGLTYSPRLTIEAVNRYGAKFTRVDRANTATVRGIDFIGIDFGVLMRESTGTGD